MALSPAQDDYIVIRANKRGSENSHRAHHHSHTVDERGFLTIVMESDANPAETHDGSRKGRNGALDQSDVNSAFQVLVDDVMTEALRHFR